MSLNVEKFRALLQRRKQQLLSSRSKGSEDRAPVELDQSKVGRLSRMDALQMQAMASALDQRRRQELQRIEAATARISEGEYGYCLKCGEAISLRRLEGDPSAPLCSGCAS